MMEPSTRRLVDRADAGRRLAQRLERYRHSHALVIALPRGGVVLAGEVSRALELPLEVLIVRKIGHPFNPEYGVGAWVEGAQPELDRDALAAAGLTEADLRQTLENERLEILRRRQAYREGRPFPSVRGRDILLVDDGIATGNTVRSAIKFLRASGARRIVVAVGVAPPEVVRSLRNQADEVVCLLTPAGFQAVGEFYGSFEQVSDAEVVATLVEARALKGSDGERHD
jgi:putative phosphoribosyl transferase